MTDELMELPEGWSYSTVKESIEIIDYRGRTPPYADEGILHLRSSNIKSGNIIWENLRYVSEETYQTYMKRGIPKVGDLLFTTEAPLGEVALVPDLKFSLAQRMIVLRPNCKLLKPKFLLYQIQDEKFQYKLKFSGTGSTVKGVSSRNFQPLEIVIAPLNEQKRIVAKIEALQQRSQRVKAELEAIRPLLDNFRQSVLAAAFRGDLTKDWREKHPDIEPASELLERIKIERLKSYEEECQSLKLSQKRVPKLFEFQEILNLNNRFPDSWNIISLESACLFIIDCLHSTPKYTEKGIYCIDTTCIEPSQINWHKARKVSFDSFIKRTSRMVPQPGDVLFSREGTIGIVVSILDDSPKLCLGQRMMMFRFMPAVVPKYAEMYLQSLVFVNQYRPLIVGTTSPHINIGDIRKMLFLLPSIKEQQEIVKRIESLFKIADTIEQQYQKAQTDLETLNQSILAKAFRGELVPQNPKDEPVSVLLERIRAELETHNKTSKQKKSTTTKTTNRSRKKTTKKPPLPDTPTKLKLPEFE